MDEILLEQADVLEDKLLEAEDHVYVLVEALHDGGVRECEPVVDRVFDDQLGQTTHGIRLQILVAHYLQGFLGEPVLNDCQHFEAAWELRHCAEQRCHVLVRDAVVAEYHLLK